MPRAVPCRPSGTAGLAGEIEGLARRAARLAKENTIAAGFALAHVGQLETGAVLIDRTLIFDPNLAAGWHLGALGAGAKGHGPDSSGGSRVDDFKPCGYSPVP